MAFQWSDLPKPVVGLSAMDGVTDAAMRQITKEIGNPDFMVTEFTSADGIVHGVEKLMRDFSYTPMQRPIIAQIFGSNPDAFYECAKVCCRLGFDGIDINMGCPADSVSKKGGGAYLIKTPKLAQTIVKEVKKGVADSDSTIPVSVKTRIGYDKPITSEWISILLETEPAVITLHGRTLEQHYSGEANWEEIAKAVPLVHQTNTLLFGNGDLNSPELIVKRVKESGVDGAWVARAAMGNPWIFKQYEDYVATGTHEQVSLQERLAVALKHARLFEELNQTTFKHDPYPFLNMRKHLGWYVSGLPNAGALRQQLYTANTADDVKRIIDDYSRG